MSGYSPSLSPLQVVEIVMMRRRQKGNSDGNNSKMVMMKKIKEGKGKQSLTPSLVRFDITYSGQINKNVGGVDITCGLLYRLCY